MSHLGSIDSSPQQIRRRQRDTVAQNAAGKNNSQAGIILPGPPSAGGNYVSAKTVGNLVFLAGVISTSSDGVIFGTVGVNRTIEEACAAARACALTQLAVLRQHLGSLDTVAQIVSVNGYVNAVPGFSDSPKVINGASDLLIEIFGEAGRHTAPLSASAPCPAMPSSKSR